jgi:hypothetical protein
MTILARQDSGTYSVINEAGEFVSRPVIYGDRSNTIAFADSMDAVKLGGDKEGRTDVTLDPDLQASQGISGNLYGSEPPEGNNVRVNEQPSMGHLASGDTRRPAPTETLSGSSNNTANRTEATDLQPSGQFAANIEAESAPARRNTQVGSAIGVSETLESSSSANEAKASSDARLKQAKMTRAWVEENCEVVAVSVSDHTNEHVSEYLSAQSDSEDELFSWKSNSDCPPETLPSGHPLNELRTCIVQYLVVAFKSHALGHNGSNATSYRPTTSSSDQRNVKSGQAGALKRKGSDKSSDEQDAPKVNRRKISVSSDENDEKLLACPFCKYDARRYRDCYKYILRDISRLKQHLGRKHRIPIHCPSCSLEFDLEEQRDAHIRLRSCEVLPPREWEGINQTQKLLLEKRIDAKKTKEENWYIIYEILFPGSPRPRGPYVDAPLSEELLALREYIVVEGPGFIRDLTQRVLPEQLRPQQDDIQAFVETVFPDAVGFLLDEYSMRRPSEVSQVPPMIPEVLSHSSESSYADVVPTSDPSTHDRNTGITDAPPLAENPLFLHGQTSTLTNNSVEPASASASQRLGDRSLGEDFDFMQVDPNFFLNYLADLGLYSM